MLITFDIVVVDIVNRDSAFEWGSLLITYQHHYIVVNEDELLVAYQ